MTTNQSDDFQTPKRRPVRGISFQEKLAILNAIETGVSRREICENFKCCESTLSRVIRTKQTILQLAEQDKNLNRKRVAMVTYKEIDEALSKWAQEMKRNNVVITAALAKEKAEEIAGEMGQEFKPSAGWLYKWKERQNVQFGKKPKVVDLLMSSLGNEEILKGLLERNDKTEKTHVQQNTKTRLSEDYNEQLGEPQDDIHGFNETAASYGSLNGSEDFKNSEIELKMDTPTTPNNTPVVSTKKVPYSYDPVYILTSTGRYRKEKTFLTLLQKLEILQRLKNGEKRPDLINEYRLSQSAMSQIVADEKKILKLAAIGQNLQMKRVRGGIFKGGESELNTWVLKKIEDGETLTRTQIKNKAKEIAERLHIDFKASTGWLEKWKARMNMDFNENQILHRKIPSYISNTDEETHLTDESHIPEAIYGEDDDEQIDDDHIDVKKELAEAEVYSFEDNDDHAMDIKPLIIGQEQICEQDISDEEPMDVKPFINSPPSTTITIAPSPSPSPPPPPVAAPVGESIHQKILNWLSKYNIGPTASIELLTILHPVIADKPENPQPPFPHEQQRRQPYS